MERWSGIPADGLLTMPITLTVPLDLILPSSCGHPVH